MAVWGSRVRSLAIAGREALSFARQAWLLPRDTGQPVIPEEANEGDDVVVFLHGLFASAGVLRPMRSAVDRHPRVHTATFTYAPGPSLDELASRLASITSALPDKLRLHLVGHSLGGVVARLHAQSSRDARIVQTISIAAPFAGIPRAKLLSFPGARDIEPGAPALRRLLLEAASCAIPHLSILSTDDSVLPSPLAHAFPGGEVHVVHGLGHNTMLYDAQVTSLVERRILASR